MDYRTLNYCLQKFERQINKIIYICGYVDVHKWIDHLNPNLLSFSQTITNTASLRNEVLGVTRFSGLFPPSSWYVRTVNQFIPSSWGTGQYNITVFTDYEDDVFEFIFNHNNEKTVQVNVTRRLPDLTVTHVNASVTADDVQAYLNVSFTVENVGKGVTTEAPWFDSLYISPHAHFSQSNTIWLGDFPHRVNLGSGKQYSIDTGPIRINRDLFGQRFIFVKTNTYGSVTENDLKSNIRSSGNVTFPQVLPNLVVANFTLLSRKVALLSDSEVSLKWTVENNGTGSTLKKSWQDAVYLSKSPTVQNNSTKLADAFFRQAISPGQSYTKVSFTKLPSDISGTYYFVLKVNEDGSIVEKGSQMNNLAWIRAEILPKPLPDLAVVDISFVFEEKRRFLTVVWSVANFGSSMRESLTWVDSVMISSSKGVIDGKDARVMASETVTTKLSEQLEYQLSAALQISDNVIGTFYVHVVTNSNKTLSEVSGTSNNIGVSRNPLNLPPPPAPRLILTIISSLPSQITLGVPFSIKFQVKNVGVAATKKTSWTDALYAYDRKDANRTEVTEKGTKLKDIPHIGALKAKSFYEKTINVSIPHGFRSSAFIHGFADIHSPFTPWPKIVEPINNTQPNVTHPNVTQPNVTLPTVTPTVLTPIVITEGLLPDLQGSLGDSKVQTRGGQPLNVTFNVTNTGESPVWGAWYNALYLSQDVLIDPFDRKLASVRATNLAVNDTVSLSAEVFIPFDTLDLDYYLLLSVDSKSAIWESDEQNNDAYRLIKINKTFSSDLAVLSVSSSGGEFSYGQGKNFLKHYTPKWKS